MMFRRLYGLGDNQTSVREYRNPEIGVSRLFYRCKHCRMFHGVVL